MNTHLYAKRKFEEFKLKNFVLKLLKENSLVKQTKFSFEGGFLPNCLLCKYDTTTNCLNGKNYLHLDP